MAGSITGANATIFLSLTGLFPAPIQLQGFATDDVFDTNALESTETMMGVDGHLSAGFVNVPVIQSYTLQADSDSNSFFDQWFSAQKLIGDVFFANGIVLLPSLFSKWTMTRGALTSYSPIPAIKKLAQPRKFTITWQSVRPSLVG